MSIVTRLCNIQEEEYITCQRIVEYCRATKIPYIKPDPIKYRVHQFRVINNAWHAWHIFRNPVDKLLVELDKIPVIVTGYSDHPIDSMESDLLNQPSLKAWFANNVNIRHPKLHAIPMGLPNEVDFAIQGNTKTLRHVADSFKMIENLAYMGFKIDTFPIERQQVYNLFADKPWVTKGKLNFDEAGHLQYLKDIHSHKFCICPRGNGFDSHRMMEALYLGTIPIVKKCIAMEQFYDFPVLFIDDWNEVTQEFLHAKYDEITSKEYDLDKLYVSHWFNRISASSV